MEIKVIPGILEKDFEGIKKKVGLVAPYVDTIQIDLADGKLVPNTTFSDPEPFKEIIKGTSSLDFARDGARVGYELHMMVSEPGEIVDRWIDAGFKRIIGHIEGIAEPMDFLTRVKTMDIDVGLAVDNDTRISLIEDYLDFVDLVLIMAIRAGFSGQEFIPEDLDKVRWLRGKRPNMDIEVDGGINLETARQAKEAGANILVSTSFIFDGDVKDNINKLRSI